MKTETRKQVYKTISTKTENIENMKTRISQLAAITLFALIFLAGNVNAKGTELNASSHESIETTLELENWMVNDNLWTTDGAITLENAVEESLDLESWMTNESIWETESLVIVEKETEQELAIEPWMTNENNWSM